MKFKSEMTEQTKNAWTNAFLRGATIYQELQNSLYHLPSRWQWEAEFEKQGGEGLPSQVMEVIWAHSEAAVRLYDENQGAITIFKISSQAIDWESVEKTSFIMSTSPQAEKTVKVEIQPEKKVSKMKDQTIMIIAAVLFIAACLFPPWEYTADHNGNNGFHTRKPARYSLIFTPPNPENDSPLFGVQIDISRLIIEMVVIGVTTGLILFVRQKKRSDE